MTYDGEWDGTAIEFVESGYVSSDTYVCYILSYPVEQAPEFTDVVSRMDNELYIE